MKIPTYTSQATPTSEAPGTSFTARMRAEPFIRAELEKGQTFSAAASQVAEFADMRYRMQREARLNDALLAADEQLREETISLSKSKDIYNVLDGDDPKWKKSVNGIRDTLRATIGTDRSALRAFDEKFKQAEMTQRFRLRGVVDTKIQQAINAQRLRNLQVAEDNAVAAGTIDDIFLELSKVKIDGARAYEVLKADPAKLQGQQAKLVQNIANRRIQELLANTDKPLAVMSALRAAVIGKDQSALTDPRLQGKGIAESALLELLPLAERVKLLSGGETLAKYVNGPTLEESVNVKKAASELGSVTKSAEDMISLLNKNIDVSDTQLDDLAGQIAVLEQTLPADDLIAVKTTLQDARDFKAFKSEVASINTPDGLTALIEGLESNTELDSTDVKYIQFARNMLVSTYDAIDKDVVAWARSSGASRVTDVDLTFANPEQTALQLKSRMDDAAKLHTLSGRERANLPMKIFSEAEEEAFIASFEAGSLSQKMSTLIGLEKTFADNPRQQSMLQDMYATIAEKQPLMAHAGALITMGRPEAAREILQGLEQKANGATLPKTASGAQVDAVIRNYLGEALRFQPQAAQAIVQASEAILLNRFVGVADMQMTDDNILQAVQVAAGRMMKDGRQVGGLALVNDTVTFLPKDRDVGRFETTMDNLTPEMFLDLGYEIDASLWNQVIEGDWSFQVAGDGQYRVMQDNTGTGVPEFMMGFAVNKEGNPQEPVLINYKQAEALLLKTRAEAVGERLIETGSNIAGFGSEIAAQIPQPEMPTPTADAAVAPGQSSRDISYAQMAVMLKDKRTSKQKAEVISTLVPPNRFETVVKPLLDTVPNEVSDDEYVDYVDAVLDGLSLSYEDWKATQ